MDGNFDPVEHPSHYTDGKYEVIDFIETWGLGFHLGNAVKYISRAGKKDPNKEIEDLKKAIWYLKRAMTTGLAWPERTTCLNDRIIPVWNYCTDKELSVIRSKAIEAIVGAKKFDELYRAVIYLEEDIRELQNPLTANAVAHLRAINKEETHE